MKKLNLPTKITIARIFLAVALVIGLVVFYLLDQFGVFYVREANLWMQAGSGSKISVNYLMLIFLGVFLLASLSDFLYGYLARKNNQVTDLGKFLDPLADKMLIDSLMIFLSFNFVSLDGDAKFPFFCVIIMTIRDLIVDGMRLMAARKNVVVAANIYGKLKTVTQMAAIVVVLLNGFPFSFFDNNRLPYLHVSDWLCYIATFFSVFSGVIYMKENMHIFGGKNNE